MIGTGKEKYGKSRLYGSVGFMLISLVLAKFLSEPSIAIHYYLALNILTVIFAAVGLYIIFLPKVLHDIGYSTFDIGIIFALAPLMRFLTPFLFLKHIKLDQKMFKTALYLSVIASTLFYVTIDNFFLFMINNALLGVCLSLILPYLEVTAISTLGKEKYGKSRLYGSIGFMLISLV